MLFVPTVLSGGVNGERLAWGIETLVIDGEDATRNTVDPEP